MEAIPILLFWAIVLFGLVSRRPVLIYFLFFVMSFGSFVVIPTSLTAGLSLIPTPVVALFIVIRQFSNKNAIQNTLVIALRYKYALLLTLFWVVSICTTIFMPRLFYDSIMIVPVKIEWFAAVETLRPTNQNFSQASYLTISVASVFVFAQLFRHPIMRQHAMSAMVIGGVVVVVTGLLDLSSNYLPILPILDVFRTANYGLAVTDEILGEKRVVGLMNEASSYGSLSLAFLSAIYFLRRGMPRGFSRDRLVPILIPALCLMVWLSISSSAYVGFALFGFAAVLEWLWRIFALPQGDLRRQYIWHESVVAVFLVVVFCLVMSVNPKLLDSVLNVIDVMIFQKSSTDSYYERNLWTSISWQALLDTYGFGVGLGGTRTSNGAVAIFSNTGYLGGCLYFAFVLQSVLRSSGKVRQQDRATAAAIFWAFLPPFTSGLLAGTTPDFGILNAFLFGLALAVTLPVPAANLPLAREHGQLGHPVARKPLTFHHPGPSASYPRSQNNEDS